MELKIFLIIDREIELGGDADRITFIVDLKVSIEMEVILQHQAYSKVCRQVDRV